MARGKVDHAGGLKGIESVQTSKIGKSHLVGCSCAKGAKVSRGVKKVGCVPKHLSTFVFLFIPTLLCCCVELSGFVIGRTSLTIMECGKKSVPTGSESNNILSGIHGRIAYLDDHERGKLCLMLKKACGAH